MTAASLARPSPFAGLLGRFASQEMVLLLALVIAVRRSSAAINPRFLAERNLQTIFLGNAYIAVAAIGMSMVIISGNIDISVGSLIGVLATVSRLARGRRLADLVSWLVPVLVGDGRHGRDGRRWSPTCASPRSS